ncbi:GrpB family protein [Aquabacterium sp. A7-Y]|uniref:GrpB family protein n=1 Tax=Aquabacterium sp. A7-Y TaxID=1349605 RepID=UPI00223D892C|nr:GrpB family protein [Aquabacterium sp. A7-Y]MCW7539662.1 GrpB family protein [Aquabacterium sp. A7-Y]
MTDQESLLAAIHESVELVPYDPAWPPAFEEERWRLLSLFPSAFVAIEHIGSTAIPGMRAKPIVDILAGVESLTGVDALAARLCEVGYATSAEFNASLSDRKWFMRWAHGRRTHHLHVVVHDGGIWRQRLAFRDRLRVDPQAAARYERLKARLAAEHRDDREAYTDAKADFVQSIVAGVLW